MSQRLRFFSDNCFVIPTDVVAGMPAPTDPAEALAANPHWPWDEANAPGKPADQSSPLDLIRVEEPLGNLDPFSSPEAKAQFGRDVEAGLAASAKELAAKGERGRPVVVVEITNKVIGDRFHLRPDEEVRAIFLGVLARALLHSGAGLVDIHVLSNHVGLLVIVHSVDQLADLTRYLFQATSYRIRRHLGLDTSLWAGRYKAIVLIGDEATQAARLKYCLANGTKENLVAHPSQWPGIHGANFFCNGQPLVGTWTDFTAFGKAKRRDPNARSEGHQTRYTVPLTKLPSFAHLSDDAYAAMYRGWCDEAAEKAEIARAKEKNAEPGDPEALRQVDLNHRPENPARSQCPLVHSVDPAEARRYREAYKAYVAHHQALRASLAAGLKAKGVDFAGGLLPTGWIPIDPATVVPHPAIVLSEVATVT